MILYSSEERTRAIMGGNFRDLFPAFLENVDWSYLTLHRKEASLNRAQFLKLSLN